nr:ADP-ribosylglycohydrolase family protein [Actinomadura sp. BRA 177]
MRRASGAMFGLAYGDSLGAPTEFLTMKQIHRIFGDHGPTQLDGDPALVTDDTQMAIAVGLALLDALANPPFTPDLIIPMWRRHFIDWLNSPDNNRAPGNTCLRACRNLQAGQPWVKATVAGSKGAGPTCGSRRSVSPLACRTRRGPARPSSRPPSPTGTRPGWPPAS